MTIRGPFAVTLLVLLFVSVAANLLVAGFVVARFAGGPPPGFGGGDIDRLVTLGIGSFPRPIQDEIRQNVRDQRMKFRTYLDGIRTSRQKMFEVMRAPDFDRAALDGAFADLRDDLNGIQMLGQSIVGDAVAAAPADVRAQIRPPRGPGGPFQ
jgi:uncharacterized membrane protein